MKVRNLHYYVLAISMINLLLTVGYNQMSNAISSEEHENLQYMIPVTSATIIPQQSLNDTKNNVSSSSSFIPEIAKGSAIPSKGYLVEEIRDNLYWVTDGVYNTMFLVSNDGVIAVDAPPSLGEKYVMAIKEVTDLPIKFVIYSHSHADHIGAAGSIFPDNVTYIAHEDTANLLKIANDSKRPISSVTFKDHYNVTLGNQTLELDYNGLNHEPGNIYIYAPKQKTLMLVDVVFPGWAPFKDLAITSFVPGFVKAHEIVLTYDFDSFIGGHLTRLGTVDDVKIQREFVNDLINASRTANGNHDFMAFVGEYGLSNPWLVFSKYADAITNDCTKSMLAKWKDRLGGTEEFMESHCWKMTESQRVD